MRTRIRLMVWFRPKHRTSKKHNTQKERARRERMELERQQYAEMRPQWRMWSALLGIRLMLCLLIVGLLIVVIVLLPHL